MFEEITLSLKKAGDEIADLTVIPEFNHDDGENFHFSDVNYIDLDLFNIKCGFAESNKEASIEFFICDMLLYKRKSPNLLNLSCLKTRQELNYKNLIRKEIPMKITRFGNHHDVLVSVDKITIKTDGTVFEIICFNDGYIQISRVDGQEIKNNKETHMEITIS